MVKFNLFDVTNAKPTNFVAKQDRINAGERANTSMLPAHLSPWQLASMQLPRYEQKPPMGPVTTGTIRAGRLAALSGFLVVRSLGGTSTRCPSRIGDTACIHSANEHRYSDNCDYHSHDCRDASSKSSFERTTLRRIKTATRTVGK